MFFKNKFFIRKKRKIRKATVKESLKDKVGNDLRYQNLNSAVWDAVNRERGARYSRKGKTNNKESSKNFIKSYV